MSNEIRLENIKRLQKIANEINLIYQQIKDENVLKTLHDENTQRFIFVSLIKISESFKKIKESADDEILSLFDKKDLKRINDTRNFTAHDNEEIRLSAVANVIKYDLFRVKRSINIYMGKLENQKQEVEIMENVARKKGLSLNAKIITALLVAIVLALSLLLSMVDTMNTTNIIKEKFVTFIDRLSYSEIVFLSMIAFISIIICLVLIGVLKNKKLLFFAIFTSIFTSVIIANILIFNFIGLFFLVFFCFIFLILYSVLSNINKRGKYEAYQQHEDLFEENDSIVTGSRARRFGMGIYE
ncbi:HepT-like ribonuclease domain-containing protein [Campylobacter jejuni]|uniref:HepT-like ribonuclease domain-containing protein n=1 Tax=Campylobacter jejuni TaxID=197 RepID=UPI003B9ADA17